jgi:iron-sulfur cluster repair protein YtfE (RIC family)
MENTHIEEIKKRVADLKKRWPKHSVPAALMQELDELEEELEMNLLQEENKQQNTVGQNRDA